MRLRIWSVLAQLRAVFPSYRDRKIIRFQQFQYHVAQIHFLWRNCYLQNNRFTVKSKILITTKYLYAKYQASKMGVIIISYFTQSVKGYSSELIFRAVISTVLKVFDQKNICNWVILCFTHIK